MAQVYRGFHAEVSSPAGLELSSPLEAGVINSHDKRVNGKEMRG